MRPAYRVIEHLFDWLSKTAAPLDFKFT